MAFLAGVTRQLGNPLEVVMAWDKVTKIDSIAKRKAWTKSNLGKHVEYADTMKKVSESGRAYSAWWCVRGDTVAQSTVKIDKRGRLRHQIGHGNGSVSTSWPVNGM